MHEDRAGVLKEIGKVDRIECKKKKLKNKKRPEFPYYAILRRWKMLFALARTALRPWLRKPDKCCQRKQPNIPGLIMPPV